MEDELNAFPMGLNALQSCLDPRQYGRSLERLKLLFLEGGVDLENELDEAVRSGPQDEPC